MTDYDSVHDFVKEIAKRDGPLDLAVLNASVFSVKYEKPNHCSWEHDLQVNLLSTALLSLLLLKSKIINPEGGVLEFVALRRMQAVQLTEAEINSSNLLEMFNHEQTKFDASRQYQASKLFLMAFYKSLAARLPHSSAAGPIITAVCPGFCQSDLSRGHQGITADVLRAILNTIVLRSTEEGARTLVTGAMSERERHGEFWFDDALHDVEKALSHTAGDVEAFCERVWEEVLQALRQNTHVPFI